MRWNAAIWLVGALMLAALPAHAQWKWKDKSGQIHISDLPPPNDVPDKDVLQRPAAAMPAKAPVPQAPTVASSAPASAPKPKVDAELEARRTKAEQEQKAKAKAEEERNAAIRAENCQRARQALATLQSGVPMARINAKGEREVYDDQIRAAETQRVQADIAANCR